MCFFPRSGDVKNATRLEQITLNLFNILFALSLSLSIIYGDLLAHEIQICLVFVHFSFYFSVSQWRLELFGI